MLLMSKLAFSLFVSSFFLISIFCSSVSHASKGDCYVLVTNSESNSICSYKLDKETGSWIFCDKTATGKRPMGLAVSMESKSIYVSNNNSNSISKITLNPGDGTFASAKEIIPTSKGPLGLCTSKDGKFLFSVSNEACELQSFDIERSEVSLRHVCSVSAEGFPQTLAMHPKGQFIYVPSSTKDKILHYQFDTESGSITLISEVPAGERPTALSIDPTGKFLFLANMDSNTIWAYKIDPENGKLYPSSEIGTGASPEGLVIHNKLPFIYAVSSCSEELHSIRVDKEVRRKTILTCSLSQASGPISDLQLPRNIVASPDGKFIFVLQRSQMLGEDRDKVAVFQVNSETGELNPSGGFEILEEGEKCIEIFEVES